MTGNNLSEASLLPDSWFIHEGEHTYGMVFGSYVRRFRDCIVAEMGKPDGNNGLGIAAQCVFETGKRMTRDGYDAEKLGRFIVDELESAMPIASGNTLIYMQQVRKIIEDAIGPRNVAA